LGPLPGPALGNPGLGHHDFTAIPGPGTPPPPAGLQQDRNFEFDPLRDPIRTTGTIDPDEPTEGIRLM
jgi:hypothetical protein